jgi:glycosyltransferase involved in cell wall biosynthesis
LAVKVFVQIPTYKEEETLGLVLESIPKKIPDVDLEILIIDDSPDDKTINVAKKFGVKHFVKHPGRMGLARAFSDGVAYALDHGADIVVNTDADNQYPQEKIPELIQPIIEGKADIVVADRQTQKIAHFSPLKKMLQRFGSFIVNKAAGTEIPDAASGFRAYSRSALIRINIITQFSYTMESIIQAGNKRIAITSIPVKTNPKTRESRLFNNMWEHVFKSMSAIVRAYIMYKPYMVFASLGYTLLVIGLIPFVRYLILYIILKHPSAHLQSLILGAVFLIGAFLCLVLNIVADLTRTNRILLEEALEQIKYQRFNRKP